MCGISGSNKREQAFKLYQDNLNRGFYSSGLLTLSNKDKAWGAFKTEGSWPKICTDLNISYYLYHSRGPTTETKSFNPINNHPFFYGDWIVAHNGIISNFKELGVKYFPEDDFTEKTDSCIIPRMLSIKPTINESLEELKGTFALWMHNIQSKKTFITRCASTLFGDFTTGDFSSTHFEGSSVLKEGVVYDIEGYNTIKPISSYKTVSPYFIL
jgi:glucosamine 6-phosphate synthetase-like amidotransferase/phosphosugar isomerase protein